MDYEAVNETLTFSSVLPEMCIVVLFIPDDITEDSEVFYIVASSLSTSVSFTVNQISVSILDDSSKLVPLTTSQGQYNILRLDEKYRLTIDV